MAELDRKDFLAAMVKDIEDHLSREHWELMLRNCMPSGTKTIWSIWSFKRKQHPDGTLNKHKARLCDHGGMQVWGENYWETYAPVVNWLSVRLLMTVARIHGISSKSIDFVLAFPQAELEVDIFMEILAGMQVKDNNVPETRDGVKGKYVLKL